MTADLTNPIFQDETKAREWLEATRWPEGPHCPHCGTVGDRITKVETKKRLRPGLYVCNECHSQFTVTIGTVYERSHIPLHKWLLATHLMTASKKGVSAHQLHRMLGITYKSAWFMAHRIREGMREFHPAPMGGNGKTVEADETHIGGKEKNKHARKRAPARSAAWARRSPFRSSSVGARSARITFRKSAQKRCARSSLHRSIARRP